MWAEGLGWVLKALMCMEGIGCVGTDWDGYERLEVDEWVLELIRMA